MKKSTITKETPPDEVRIIKDKAGVAFYEARYGDRWGCPVCLEFKHIDGSKPLFGHCTCTKASIAGTNVDDPTAAWNQPDYQPEPQKWIDWENA